MILTSQYQFVQGLDEGLIASWARARDILALLGLLAGMRLYIWPHTIDLVNQRMRINRIYAFL